MLLAGATCQVAVHAAETGQARRFAGQMCVRPLQAAATAADCGAVEIVRQGGNRLSVRISDIVYRLQLHANQLDVVLMHGTMQIDGFSTAYDWQGRTLLFDDPEKGLGYEIHFDEAAERARADHPSAARVSRAGSAGFAFGSRLQQVADKPNGLNRLSADCGRCRRPEAAGGRSRHCAWSSSRAESAHASSLPLTR